MKIFIVIVISVLVMWGGSLLGLIHIFPSWEIRGQFGDLFGSINSLFSGLAFAALIYTIYLQRKELELQRNELSMQRQEMALQREEMVKSREELAEQAKIQRDQFAASVASLKAQAIIANIEALKVEGDVPQSSIRAQCAKKIYAESERLSKLADALGSLEEKG